MKALNVGLVMNQGADFEVVAELKNTVNGVSTPIDITGYEFVGEMRMSTNPSEPVAGGVRASGLITLVSNPADGDTLTIGGIVTTFKTTPTLASEVQIGVDTAETLELLYEHLVLDVMTARFVKDSANDEITVTFPVVGVAGNAYTLATTSANITLSGATLTGGIDPAEFVFTILDQVTNTGQVKISLPQAQVDTIAASVSGDLNVSRLKTPYVYDVKMKDTSGLKSRIMQGIVYVSPQATLEALP